MKLVREHINEKFTDVADPVSDMGIGSYYNQIKYHPISMELAKMGLKFTSTEKDIDKKKTLRFEATKPMPENLREVSFNMSPGGYFRINGRPKNKFKEGKSVEFALNYIKDNLFMKGAKLYKFENFKINDVIKKYPNNKDFEKYVKSAFKNKAIIGNFKVLRTGLSTEYFQDMAREIHFDDKKDKLRFDHENNTIAIIMPFYEYFAKEFVMLPSRTYKLREKEIGI